MGGHSLRASDLGPQTSDLHSDFSSAVKELGAEVRSPRSEARRGCPLYTGSHLACLAEREIDPIFSEQRMMAFLERHHSVIMKPRRAPPNSYITVRYRHTHGLVGSLQPAKEEYCRNAEGNRNYRRTKIPFVLVLMQGQPGSGLVAID